jgi:uncharacterized protein
MKKLFLCILLVLLGKQVFAQDYNKCRNAYLADDYETALKECKLQADQGDANAQVKLGFMYNFGNGVPQNYAKAVMWLRLSAEQNNENGQAMLGLKYMRGEGVIKDHDEAIKWLRLSANQDNKLAQYHLGNIYLKGEGILRNNVTAHMWYNISSANGYAKSGTLRDELADQMTSKDISKATAMARKCMKSDYKKCE